MDAKCKVSGENFVSLPIHLGGLGIMQVNLYVGWMGWGEKKKKPKPLTFKTTKYLWLKKKIYFILRYIEVKVQI